LKAWACASGLLEYSPGGFIHPGSQVEVSMIGIEVNRALAEPLLDGHVLVQAA
jgi:hypothetical protein